jgi:hypothetical protein
VSPPFRRLSSAPRSLSASDPKAADDATSVRPLAAGVTALPLAGLSSWLTR